MSEENQNGVVVSEDVVDLRSVMRYFPAGVTVVTALQAETNEPCGMTVSSFTSISLEPPLVAISLKKTATAAEAILAQQTFGVSILRANQEDLSNRFAGFDPQFEDHANRFAGLAVETAKTGSPLLSDALNWLDCKVWAVYDGSTHHIIIGEVIASSPVDDDDEAANPLLYYNRGYHSL